jgi:Uma2 family endonuclease
MSTSSTGVPQLPTPPQAVLTEASPGYWPRDILEAYARYPGPYTIENAETILEEEAVELYNGWLVWQDMTDAIERRIVATLQAMLDLSARKAGFGQVLPDQLECLLNDGSVVKPDASLISWARLQERVQPYGPRQRPTLMGGPELVVEVRSPSNRRAQERTKRELYFANHVQLVWDIEPLQQIIWVYQATAPTAPTEYRLPDEIDCALLPGWRRRVADIFAEQASAEVVAGEVAQAWRAEGRAEGIAEGAARILRDVLPVLIRMRFGTPPPADLSARLELCSIGQLQHLQTAVETSSSLEDWLQELSSSAR